MNRLAGAISGMIRSGAFYFVLAALLSLGAPLEARPQAASDADWPMWRRDAAHTGTTPRALADRLSLQWPRTLPPLQAGWPDQPRVQMDAVYEPVVLGRTM